MHVGVWRFASVHLSRRLVLLLTGAILLSSTICPSAAFGGLPDQRSSDVVRQTPASGDPAEASRSVDPAQLRISDKLGHIVETFNPQPKGSVPKRLVIHLQDLHTQYEAQRALAKLIQELRKSTNVSLVALEGGAGPGDTKFFSAFPDRTTNQQLAEFFLKQGLFTGPVYHAVTQPGVTLYGVEDPVAYLEHLKTYQAGHQQQQNVDRYFEPLSAILHELEDRLYSKELKTLTAKVREYEEEKLNFWDYLRYLKATATRKQLALDTDHPNLWRLMRTAELEQRIDMRTVEQEHRQLIEILNEYLRDDDLRALYASQRAVKAGTRSQADYYKGLRYFARKAGIRLTPPQQFTELPPLLQAAKIASANLPHHRRYH